MGKKEQRKDDTKTRLIEAGGEVFADHGFRGGTVRDICRRARAPLGSVNYHFRDKMGLYQAVLDSSFAQAIEKYPPDYGLSPGATPEERLRAFIRSIFLRAMAEGFPAWHAKLLAREIADSTGALDHVSEIIIRPVYEYLEKVVEDLIGEKAGQGAGDPVFLCSTSIVGQCLYHYVGRQMIESIRPGGITHFSIEALTEHVYRFSLAGIRELAKDASGEE